MSYTTKNQSGWQIGFRILQQDKYNISIGQVHKSIPTLNNKEKYVLSYRNLQLCIEGRKGYVKC